MSRSIHCIEHILNRKARRKVNGRFNVPECTEKRCFCRCDYCAEPAYAMDHTVPRVRKGPDTEENLRPVCRHCNSQKGGRSIAFLRRRIQVDALKLPVKLTVPQVNALTQVGVIFPLKPHEFWFEKRDGQIFDPDDQLDPNYGARPDDALPITPKPPPPPYVPRIPNRWTLRFQQFFGCAQPCNLRNAAFDEYGNKHVGPIPGAQVCLCHDCPDFAEEQLDRVIIDMTGLLIGILREPENKEPCKIIDENQELLRLRDPDEWKG